MKCNTVVRNMAALLLGATMCGQAYAGSRAEAVQAPKLASFSGEPAQHTSAQVAALAAWWKQFKDPQLQALVELAIASNMDVQVARARLAESRASLGSTRASQQLPTINVDGSYARTRTSADNPQVITLGGNTTSVPYVYNSYQAYFDASYEIDLFGGVRNSVRAARADADSSADSLRNTMISTMAEVARDYIQLRQYQEQLRIAHSQEASQQDTLHLIEVRNRAGLVSDLDVASARATLASTQTNVPQLESKIEQEKHAIALLLGKTPRELDESLGEAKPIPTAENSIPAGLPSELLRRRPDIRAAEDDVKAAAARVGVQVSKLFPSISLTAEWGGQSASNLGNLADSAARFYSIGPTVQWGLLNYPALKKNIQIYQSRRDQKVLNYQKTVLTAFQEVEDSLTAYHKEAQREKLLKNEMAQYQRAYDLALAKYTRGLTNYLNVLEAQRSLYTAQDALAESQATVQTDLVAFYKALGGGWEH
jgi:NodT family efflux transporter outer membrane factor (OMF) lipoprotein